MPAAKPPVSVVIASRDKPAQLRLTLACLARQAGVDRPQVIVVDDSATGSAGRVTDEAARYLDLTALPGPRRGRAAARNAGAARAASDWLLFLDDDILTGAHFAATHLAALADRVFCHGRLRELPAAGRLLAELDGAAVADIGAAADRVAAGLAGPRFRLVANALERAVEALAEGRVPDVAPWLGCVGANVSVPKGAFDQVGGFAEEFGLAWGCEDLELGLRLYRCGLRRVLAADALGVHLSHARPGRWAEHTENLEKFVARHPIAAVRELPALLGADGSVDDYVAAVQAAQPAPPAQSARPALAIQRPE